MMLLLKIFVTGTPEQPEPQRTAGTRGTGKKMSDEFCILKRVIGLLYDNCDEANWMATTQVMSQIHNYITEPSTALERIKEDLDYYKNDKMDTLPQAKREVYDNIKISQIR